jgi:hypothetical protein
VGTTGFARVGSPFFYFVMGCLFFALYTFDAAGEANGFDDFVTSFFVGIEVVELG